MKQANQDAKFEVSLQACDEGDCLKIEISGDQSMVIFLSPSQARTFASELIQTVYRAEVKNSLQNTKKVAVASNKVEIEKTHFASHPHAA